MIFRLEARRRQACQNQIRLMKILTDETTNCLRCPVCAFELAPESGETVCTNAACGAIFPIVDGVPVLINESNSIFQIVDFVNRQQTTYNKKVGWKKIVRRFLPDISHNLKARRNYEMLAAHLKAATDKPKILIVGGAVAGEGLNVDELFANAEIVESDVAFGARTNLICDAHDLPFAAETFDAVIAQAVLEHVLNPARCADEMCRVLKPRGVIYAETPFMQQVHAGRFDFTRFTQLGHRRLFRQFREIESGAVCGSGMALAWSWAYFLMSFARTKTGAQIAFGAASLSGFWLKYFDYLTIDTAGTLDAASGFYFFGEKSTETLPDKQLIAEYKGLI